MQQLKVNHVSVSAHESCTLKDQPRVLRAALAIARAAPGTPGIMELKAFTPTDEVWCLCPCVLRYMCARATWAPDVCQIHVRLWQASVISLASIPMLPSH